MGEADGRKQKSLDEQRGVKTHGEAGSMFRDSGAAAAARHCSVSRSAKFPDRIPRCCRRATYASNCNRKPLNAAFQPPSPARETVGASDALFPARPTARLDAKLTRGQTGPGANSRAPMRGWGLAARTVEKRRCRRLRVKPLMAGLPNLLSESGPFRRDVSAHQCARERPAFVCLGSLSSPLVGEDAKS